MSDFDADYAKQCVTLDDTNLQGQFVRYTPDLYFWGAKLALVKQSEGLAKMQKDVVAADLDATGREALAGDKKPTEGMVAAWVTRHPAMQEAEKALLEAVFETERVKAVYDALRAKRDMLVGLGAQHRAEMQHEPSIKMEF